MSFNTLLSHTITTYRNKPTGIGITKSFQINLLNVAALIQPVTAEYANKINEVFGRTYNLYLPLGTDVQISDKIIDQDAKEYRVTGSLKRNYGVSEPHLTFIITEQVTSTPDQ